MKMRQAGLIGAVTIVLGVSGAVFLVKGRAPQKPTATAVSPDELSQVKDEVARLRNQVALSNVLAPARNALLNPVVAQAEPEPPATSANAVEANDHVSRAQPAPNQPTMQEIQETRLEIFKNEPVDAAWRREAEVSAQRQVSTGLPADASAGPLECRSTMCRVEISYKDMDSYKEYVKKSIESADREWKGGVMGLVIERHDNGSVRAEHYYVRPGADPMAAVLAQYQAEHE
jgi:hypothetical protein